MRNLYFFFCVLTSHAVFSQYGGKFQEPVPSEVYQFERYGNAPVSQYTGRPNVTIPLYTIKYGDITVPLNLTYNSNGIRVDEEASQVGLGWYFSTGMISQSIQGKDDLRKDNKVEVPDFLWAPYPQYAFQTQPGWNHNTYNAMPTDPSRILLSPIQPNATLDQYFVARVRNEGGGNMVYYPRNGVLTDYTNAFTNAGHQDIEIDIFDVNFFGHSLKFYIKPVTNLNAPLTAVVLNHEKYKININRTANILNQYDYEFIIIPPDGIAYHFAQQELIEYSPQSSSTSIYNESGYSDTGYQTNVSNLNSYGFSSSSHIWKITKIVDLKGNEVTFEYDTTLPVSGSKSASHDKCEFINVTDSGSWYPSYHVLQYFGPNFTQYGLEGLYDIGKVIVKSSESTVIRQKKSILKEINFGLGKVFFQNTSRLDIPGDKKVSALSIEYGNNVVKSINLTYDYFDNGFSDNTQKRLQLQNVTIGDAIYTFSYNNTPLPPKNSFAFDHWGYYNGQPNISSISNPFRLLSNYSNIPAWAKSFLPIIEGKANRSAHPDYCKAGILEKVKYPTGGSTEFVYELNEFDNYFFPDINNKVGLNSQGEYISDYVQTSSKGYGLRIKETIDRVDESGASYKKEYTYFGGKHIPPCVGASDEEAYHAVRLSNAQTEFYQVESRDGWKIISYSSSFYQSTLLGNGDHVGYDAVTVEEKSENDESIGKTKYYYTNVADQKARDVFGTGMSSSFFDYFAQSIRNSDVENGILYREEIYDKNNAKKRVTSHRFSSVIWPTLEEYNVKLVTLPGRYGYKFYTEPSEIVFKEYLLFYYPLKQSNTKLTGKTVTEYYENGTKWISTSNVYNGDGVLTGKTMTDQTGTFYTEQSTMDSRQFLRDRNALSLPYSQVVTENQTIKSYKEYNYIEDNDRILLSIESILPDGSPNPANKKRIIYDAYDEGKLIQYHVDNDVSTTDDDLYTCIVWGYNKTLPIAKIENAKLTELNTGAISAAVNASNSNDENNLLSMLSVVRSAHPNSMVTTYSHYPLIGVHSIGDAKGERKTFNYDSQGRLVSVKDNNGKIISENSYHFQTQNQQP